MSMLARWLSRVVAACFLVSCGSSAPVGPKPAPVVRLQVVAQPRANQGRSLRMIVREIDDAVAFVTDDYTSMVRLATEPDDTVLADRFLRPGSTLELDVAPAAEKLVGVYFFFSAPHPTKWKVRTAAAPSTARILVSENAVDVQ